MNHPKTGPVDRSIQIATEVELNWSRKLETEIIAVEIRDGIAAGYHPLGYGFQPTSGHQC